MKILFLYRNSRLFQQNEILKIPNEFLFGSNFLINSYKLETLNKSKNSQYFFLKLVERFFSLFTRIGLPFDYLIDNKNKINKFDTIICSNDPLSLVILFGKKIKILKKDLNIICIFQSLAQRQESYFKYNFFFKKLVSSLVKENYKILTLSDNAKNYINKNIYISNIHVLKFGIDQNFWKYKKYYFENRNYILSIGNDMNRDFETLIKANKDRYRIVIITNKKIKSNYAYRQISNLTNEEVREYFYKARFTIIPSKELIYETSGLSSILQSMACGTPVISSYSDALGEYFSDDIDIKFFKSGDLIQLREMIKYFYEDYNLLCKLSFNAHTLVRNKYNSFNMSKELKKIIDK